MITYSVSGITHIPKVWNFPAGEVGVASHYDASASSKEYVRIDACIISSDEVMQLLMLTDSLKRAYFKAEISLVLGYLPYGRQDRVCNEGESLSIKVFADLINSQGYSFVKLFDPHSYVSEALFNRCTVVRQHEIFSSLFLRKIPVNSRDVLIAPDLGAAAKIYDIQKRTAYKEVMVAHKQRDMATGWITDYKFDGDVEGKHCTVVDDLICGGMTFILLGKALKEAGAKSITLCATHGIFSKGHEVVAKWYDNVYTTNSYHKERIGEIEGVNYIKIL